MVKGDKVRLNNDLLIWAGFTRSEGVWKYPDGTTVDDGTPFFPNDFNACLEWLVPAGDITDISFMLDTGGTCQLPSCTIRTLSEAQIGYHEDIKVAFCLAVKELIK